MMQQTLLTATCLLATLASAAVAQQGAPDGEWPTYGGDRGHTHAGELVAFKLPRR